jgi:protease I
MKNEQELMDPILMEDTIPIEKLINKEPIPGVKEVLESTGIRRPRVAILSEEGFEEVELTGPKMALEQAGAKVDVISPKLGKIRGWNKTTWGKEIKVDINVRDANADHYDALVLPGGVMNSDKLRQNKDAITFVKHFVRAGKTIAAICHGPQTLIETGMIEGATMTSFPSLQTDLVNAGVDWVDKEMVHYGQFITSRKPADLEAFNSELISSLPFLP